MTEIEDLKVSCLETTLDWGPHGVCRAQGLRTEHCCKDENCDQVTQGGQAHSPPSSPTSSGSTRSPPLGQVWSTRPPSPRSTGRRSEESTRLSCQPHCICPVEDTEPSAPGPHPHLSLRAGDKHILQGAMRTKRASLQRQRRNPHTNWTGAERTSTGA